MNLDTAFVGFIAGVINFNAGQGHRSDTVPVDSDLSAARDVHTGHADGGDRLEIDSRSTVSVRTILVVATGYGSIQIRRAIAGEVHVLQRDVICAREFRATLCAVLDRPARAGSRAGASHGETSSVVGYANSRCGSSGGNTGKGNSPTHV